MSATGAVDRRLYPRHPLATGIQFYHAPSGREYQGRCVDISRGGLLMYAPATAPLSAGHSVRLTIGSINRPELACLSEKPVDAVIVRVERHKLLSAGHVAVGVRFVNP